MDLSLLLNNGEGPDGDRGSSGMQPGYHIFIKPPSLIAFKIIESFIKKIIKTITKVLKIGGFPIPILPNLELLHGIRMGFTIGEKIGFKFQMEKFKIYCVVKTKGGFAVSCDLGVDYLTILKDAKKWVGKIGKKLFDKAGKAFMEVKEALGDFAEDIAEGAKKVFTDLKEKAKKAYADAKNAVTILHDKTKKALGHIKIAKENSARAVRKAANELENALYEISDRLDAHLNYLGNKIKNLAAKLKQWFVKTFRKREWERSKAHYEAQKRRYDSEKNNEINEKFTQKDIKIREAENLEKEEVNAANIEIKKCEDDEIKGDQDKWRKNLAYEEAIQKLKEL